MARSGPVPPKVKYFMPRAAHHPVQRGAEIFAGNGFHNATHDEAGGDGMVGLSIQCGGFRGTEDVENLLRAKQDVRGYLFLRARNARLVGQQLADGGAPLAVLAILRQVAGDRIIQIQLSLFHQVVNHHGCHDLGGRKQADRRVRCHYTLAVRISKADTAIEHDLAMAAQAQADGGAHATAVQLAGCAPDGFHLF